MHDQQVPDDLFPRATRTIYYLLYDHLTQRVEMIKKMHGMHPCSLSPLPIPDNSF